MSGYVKLKKTAAVYFSMVKGHGGVNYAGYDF